MGTLSLSLTGISANYLIPQTLIQVNFAQGTLLGTARTKTVLLMGVKTTAGDATADSQVYELSTEPIVTDKFGAGSLVHKMWQRFTQVYKGAKMYGIAITESGGVAATDDITIAGPATATGTLTYTCAGEDVGVTYASGDANTDVAADLVAAINAKPDWPITAADSGGGVVAVTCRIKGTNGNWIRHRVETSGDGITASVGAAKLASGATDEVYTTALATILSTGYDYIVPGINPTAGSDTRYSALITQIMTQAQASSGLRQKAIICTADSLTNATTFVTAYNKSRGQVAWQKNSEWQPAEIAAHWCAVRYMYEVSNAWQNFDGYGSLSDDVWNVPPAYSSSDHASSADINTALGVGLTPIAVDNSKTKTYVVMSCTSAGADPRIRDTSKVTVCDSFADDLATRTASVYSRAGIADDVADGERDYPTNVCTPNRMKKVIITPLLRSYTEKTPTPWLISVEGSGGSIEGTATGIDPVVTTRMNAQVPLYVTPLAHQFQFLINESSSG